MTEEREQISISLEESSERILVLEKSNQDQTIRINTLERELSEAKGINEQLQVKLENYIVKNYNHSPINGVVNGQPTSLYNEIEMSLTSSMDEDIKSLNGKGKHNSDDSYDYSKDLDENWEVGCLKGKDFLFTALYSIMHLLIDTMSCISNCEWKDSLIYLTFLRIVLPY